MVTTVAVLMMVASMPDVRPLERNKDLFQPRVKEWVVKSYTKSDPPLTWIGLRQGRFVESPRLKPGDQQSVLDWMRTVVKGKWLPERPEQTWFGLDQRDKYGFGQYVGLSYSIFPEYMLQIWEQDMLYVVAYPIGNGSEIGPATDEDIKEHVLEHAGKLFSYPADALARADFYLWGKSKKADVWTGEILVGARRDSLAMNEEWWSRVQFLTDGNAIGFSFRKPDPRAMISGQASGSAEYERPPDRFLN